MNLSVILKGTLNIAFLSSFYTVIGGVVWYLMYYLFDEYNEEWKNRSFFYKIYDIFIELALIGIVTFWVSYYMTFVPPIFKISKKLDNLMDEYTSGIFFVFTMYIFLDDLTKKIRHVYDNVLGTYFDKLLPDEGSILDFSLRYSSRKTDSNKSVAN